ncbi:MAG: ABC transporter permease, partial [Candidatus Hodarchaeota archaeon]
MTSLRSFVAIRLILLIPMIWFLLTIIFIVLRVLPGANPIEVMSPQMPPDQAAAIAADLGLDRPIHEQYLNFLRDILILDFGKSYSTNLEIIDELRLAFGPTLMLGTFGTLIGIPLGIFLGGYAGSHRESNRDHLIRIFSIGVYAMPIFLIGTLMQIFMVEFFPDFPILALLPPGATAEFTRYTEIWFIDTLLSG